MGYVINMCRSMYIENNKYVFFQKKKKVWT